MGVGNFGISPTQLANSAFTKQASELEQRIVEKDTNRKDIQRVGGNVAAYNNAKRDFRTAHVVNKQLSSTLDSMIGASNSLTEIKSKLQSIQSIVQDSIDGNITNLDQAQEDINAFVSEIEEIISKTEYKNKKLFDGNFEISTLKDIDVSTLSLDFRNTETGTVAPPPALPGAGSLSISDAIYGPTGQGVAINDNYRFVKNTTFGTLNEIGNDGDYGVAINDNYIVEGYNEYIQEDIEIATLGIRIYDRTNGSLVVNITDDRLGKDVLGSNIAINENDQIIVASEEAGVDQSGGVVLVDGFSPMGGLGTVTQLLDTTGAAWDPSSPIQVEISNGYAVAYTDGGADNSQELLVWDLTDTGADLAKADYDFSYNNTPVNGSGGADVAINGDQLIVGGSYSNGDGFAQIYDLNNGTLGRRFELKADNDGIDFGQNVEFSNDGTQAIIAAGTEDRIFNISDGSLAMTINHFGFEKRSNYVIDGNILYISVAGTDLLNPRILAYDITSENLEEGPIEMQRTYRDDAEFDVYNGSLAVVRKNQQIDYLHDIEVIDLINDGSTTVNNDNYRFVKNTTFGTLNEIGNDGDYGVAINDNYIVEGYNEYIQEDIEIATLGIRIYDRTNGSLVVNITDDRLGKDVLGSNIAINENDQIIVASEEAGVDQSGGVVLVDGFSPMGGLGTVTQLLDTTGAAWDPSSPIQVEISNGYAVAYTDGGADNSQELLVWDLTDTGADLAKADYDFSYNNTPVNGSGGADVAINGDQLIVGGSYSNGDGFAQIYDLNNGTLGRRFELKADNDGIDFGQNVEFSNDGTQAIIAAGTEDRIFNISDGSLAMTINHFGFEKRSNYVIDGNILYISVAGTDLLNPRILAYDITSENLEEGPIEMQRTYRDDAEFDVYNGSLAVVRKNQQIDYLHDIEVIDLINDGSTTVNEDNFGEEVVMTSRYIAVGTPGYDSSPYIDDKVGAVNIYDRLSGNLVTTIQGYDAVNPIAMAGDTLAIGTATGVKFFDLLNNGNPIGTLGNGFNVTSLTMTDEYIAWGNENYPTIRFTDNDGNFDGRLGNTVGVTGNFGVTMALDGSNLIVGDTDNGNIKVVDLSISGVSPTIATISGLNLTADSQVDISGTNIAISNVNGQDIQIYDISEGLGFEALSRTITAPPGSVKFGNSIDLDGDKLAVGDARFNGNSGIAYLYDINSGTILDSVVPSVAGDGLSFFGSDVSLLGDDLAVGVIRGLDAFSNEQAGYVSLYNFTSDGSLLNPYDENPSSLVTGNGLELNIYSQQAGTLGAGTFTSLADISVSMTTASLGGQTNLGTYEDIYSIDQMISNLDGMQALIDSQIGELTTLTTNADTIEQLTKDTLDLYANILPDSQIADPNIALNLLP